MASLMRNIVKCCSSFAKEGFRDSHDIPVPEESKALKLPRKSVPNFPILETCFEISSYPAPQPLTADGVAWCHPTINTRKSKS
jgi:hypothetical protein